MSRRRVILSSDPVPGDDEDNPNNTLPPSDAPQYSDIDSGSDSETGIRTPISRLPALNSLLLPHADRETPESSPVAPTRVYRLQRSSSAPLLPSQMPSSDDTVIFTPGAEKRFVTERAQAKRRETLVQGRVRQVRYIPPFQCSRSRIDFG
jgi:hypothetical protein